MHSRAAFFPPQKVCSNVKEILGSSQNQKRSQRQILFYFFLNIIKVISCVFIAPKSFPGAAIFLAFFYSQSGSSSDSQNTCSSRSPSEPASEKFSLELFFAFAAFYVFMHLEEIFDCSDVWMLFELRSKCAVYIAVPALFARLHDKGSDINSRFAIHFSFE